MTWVQALQLVVLAVLATQVWRLHRRVRRLEQGTTRPHGQPRAGVELSHPRTGLFATLVASYAELLARRTAATPAIPAPPAAAASPPAPRVRPAAPPPAPAPAVAPGPNPNVARVAELVREGLDAAAIARRLGLAPGEVEVLAGLARARGWLP